MWNTDCRTFGQPAPVSCGKFRIVGFGRFCLLCLMFGLFTLNALQAQRPGGGPPGEDSGRGGRGGGERGGRGGLDPTQMISGMDKDGNGVITANEIEQLPGPFRDRLQQGGLDFNKGVRVEEMQQSFQRQMEERRQSGGGEDRGRDRERGFERSDRPEYTPPQEPGQGDGRGDRRDSGASGGTPAPASSSNSSSKKPRTRISALLPDAYKALDTDFDGQIALYEWRKGKRGTISQFTSHDMNGDGFLIAKELTQSTAAVTASPTSTPASAPQAAVAAVVAPAAPVAPVAVSVEAATKALGAFELLDADKSGTILGKEWDKSTRLKPKFEKGGINLALPLDKDQFTQAFVRVGADK